MLLRANTELINGRITQLGGVRGFLDEWSLKSGSAQPLPDRATVYRWMRAATLPKNVEQFLRFAAALDIDPFALISFPIEHTAEISEKILRIMQSTSSGPAAIRFADEFFGRRISWPPNDRAKEYFGRQWVVKELNHDPNDRANFYARFAIKASMPIRRFEPRVYHFAFRHPIMFRARWLQYGLVLTEHNRVRLHHINGYAAALTRDRNTEITVVETWFGPGPALFKVASLHPFSLRFATSREAGLEAIRFPG